METTKELETRVMLLQTAIYGLLQAHPLRDQLLSRLASAAEVAELEALESKRFLPPSEACPDLVALFNQKPLDGGSGQS